MSPVRILPFVVAGLLSSCAATPEFSEQTFVSIKSVVHAVQCEIANGVRAVQTKIDLKKWTVAYSLNLKVDNKNSVSVTPLDLIKPLDNGTFTLSPTPKYGETSTRTGSLAFTDPAMDAAKVDCDPSDFSNDRALVKGTLGVENWLTDAAKSGSLDEARSSEINYGATFVVETGTDLKPGFKVVNLNAGLSLSALQTRTNSLTITLKKKTPGAPPGTAADAAAKANNDFRLFNSLDSLQPR